MKLLLILFSIILFSCNSHTDINIDYPSGGFDFSKNITNKDFYHYPLIGKISRKDSFDIAYYDTYFFNLFKESNISLKPSSKPIFRLSCMDNIASYIISLTEDEIIVKTNVSGRYWPDVDADKLTVTERKHLNILRREFPLDEARSPDILPAPPPPPDQLEESIRRQKEHDSIVKNTPELLNPKYYDFLLKKADLNNNETFIFSTEIIKITKEEFLRIVNLINLSGYWKMPYGSDYCGATDATVYILEANTGKKYNAVATEQCFNENAGLSQACHELIKLARIRDPYEKLKH